MNGLNPSEYLIETARKHIEGNITIEEAQQLIKRYYRSKSNHADAGDETEEADKAANIARLLNERSFAFIVAGFTAVHHRILMGFLSLPAKSVTTILSKEWVLRGDTVLYVSFPDIKQALQYDIEQEKSFDYTCLAMPQIVSHIAKFVSGL